MSLAVFLGSKEAAPLSKSLVVFPFTSASFPAQEVEGDLAALERDVKHPFLTGG